MVLPKQIDSAGLFFDRLRLALNNFDDPEWLGNSSPLAAPYFLGSALTGTPEAHTAVGRGQALQQVIQKAADSLWSGPLPSTRDELETAVKIARQEQGNSGNRYYFLLLELRYLRRYFRQRANPLANSEQAIRDYLGVGRGPYFNHIKVAREALGQALLSLLHPTFRLEHPPNFEGELIGRELLVARCLNDLQNNKTVALSGMGGIGKTALAAAVAHQWPQQPLFWFTFLPTVNDQLSSLLFSLGFSLHQHGASGLWLQLVADNGKIENPQLALELVRGDLHTLNPKPLLCLDETDYLLSDTEKTTPTQQQLVSFLESLRSLTPMLLIGQQIAIRAETHYTVEGLTPSQTQLLLSQSGVPYTTAEADRLHRYTGGNPRMMWLCTAVCANSHENLAAPLTLTEILDSLPKSAVFQSLFSRFWQTLRQEERHFLQQIAVFRGPAPEDAFPSYSAVIHSLVQRHILQQDGQGAVSLLPILHDLIYGDHQRLPAETREQAHQAAAQIRAERGEYTAAAYHFLVGGEAAMAVQIWYPTRQQEIKRGQASTALTFFEQLSQRRLPEPEAQALAIIKAELYQLVGETKLGLAELESVNWRMEGETAVQAHLLQGIFHNALGYPQKALGKLEDGLAVIARLLDQMVRYRQQRTLIHIQQWQIPEAIREAQLAQYTAEHLQGVIQEYQGNYDEAYQVYRQALALAQSIDYETGIAQTNRDLATVLMRQSRLDEARGYLQAAIDYYETIGDRLNLEKARNTLGGIYYQAKEFEQVIAIGEASLPFFERANIPYYASMTSANLAESYFELGNLTKAEYYAHKTLSMEDANAFPYALYTLGLIQRSRKKYVEAEAILQQAQEISAANSDSFMEAYALRLLGEIVAEQGRRETAVQLIEQALQQFETLNIQPEILATRQLLVQLAE